jgi:transcription initiation factor TFIIIB Brf1 subunit/transcription initiation factor TFIIB
MARQSKSETQRMFKAIAVLLRNTTWKCGRIERLVIRYLQAHLKRNGHQWSYIKDMVQHFKLQGKQKSEFFDALRRLERRHIIRIDLL